jgi:hypothetical protein
VVAGPPVKQSLSMSGPVHRSRLLVALLATAALVACSGDDDDDGGTAGSASTGDSGSTADDSTTGTVGTGTAAPGVDGFCTAVIAADTAAAGDDDDALQGALDDLTAEAPEELEETVATVVASAEADQPLGEAYTELIEFMVDNCGFSEIALTTAATSFNGVPSAAPEGPVIITVDNTSDVEQAVVIARINDDVTEPATELARLPTAEAFERFVVKSSVAVAPGGTGFATADLDPGRYFAAAILPEGTLPGGGTPTSTVAGAGPATTSAPTGETLGIVKEFTVS